MIKNLFYGILLLSGVSAHAVEICGVQIEARNSRYPDGRSEIMIVKNYIMKHEVFGNLRIVPLNKVVEEKLTNLNSSKVCIQGNYQPDSIGNGLVYIYDLNE